MEGGVKSRLDRSTAVRTVPMKVLVLGMPRTRTNSMRDALKLLGFNECYHQVTLIHNPDDATLWKQAMDAKHNSRDKPFQKEDWDALLGHCQAVCDIPAMHFAEELMETYPDAKVILTNRNIDAWHRSVSNTIEKRYTSKLVYFLSFLDDVTALWTSIFYRGWESLFENDFERNGRRVYLEHYEMVRVKAREGSRQLLEYEVGDGWGPLCEFLEVPVPEKSFPKGNDQASFHAAVSELDRSRTWLVASKATLLGAGCAVVLTLAFKMRQVLRE